MNGSIFFSSLLLILTLSYPGRICSQMSTAPPDLKVQETHSFDSVPVKLPFHLHWGYLVTVEGSIGNVEKLHFLIDTGANPSVVDQKIAHSLGLAEKPARVTLSSSSVQTRLVVVHGAIANQENLNFLVDTGAVPSVVHQRLARRLDLRGATEEISMVNPDRSVERLLLPALRPTIRIRVNNYTQATSAMLAGAEREAGRILGKAGLQTVWLDCHAGHSSIDSLDPCRQPLEATDIALRVLSESSQNKFRDTAFGFAVVPILASIYYDYVAHLARSDNAEFEIPIILGCVIAHEIGHLLLGSNSHSASGIMQGNWQRGQIRKAMTGTLLFTPEQAELIRAETQKRMRLQTSACWEWLENGACDGKREI